MYSFGEQVSHHVLLFQVSSWLRYWAVIRVLLLRLAEF